MKSGLGRGLDSLWGLSENEEIKAYDDKGGLTQGVEEMSVKDITPNPNQPRKIFDIDRLNELAQSIMTHGVLQPIVVSRSDGKHVIVAGERRYRAAKLAGMQTVPVIVKDLSPQECREIALIENLQRENLNVMEEAYALKALLEECNMTQEQLSERLGKSRPAISNTIRLLNLPQSVIELVRADRLSAGHARALVALRDESVQSAYATAAADKGMSVRELENMVAAYLNPEKKKALQKPPLTRELKQLVSDMQRVFATKIKAVGTENKGRIYIDYYTKDDLERIYDVIHDIRN